jgi:molybdopterin synthase catalytic subunit
MTIKIVESHFEPWQEVQIYQNAQAALTDKAGAAAVFVGTMRDFNAGHTVSGMCLEYYPGMTEKQLEKVISQANTQWQMLDCLLIHRVGDILPHEAIVLVAVWSFHRGDALDACRYLIDSLKTQAPFWKKERIGDSACWVAGNTKGYYAIE